MSTSDKNQHTSALDDDSISAISAAIKPADLSTERKASMHGEILKRIHSPSPEGASTIRDTEGEWLEVAPKLHMKVLRRDHKTNSQTALWRLEPGAAVPPHPHPVEEECLVIEGEINFGDHYLRAGDFEVVKAGIDHTGMESKTGALLLLRSDIPQDLSWIE